MYRYTTVKEAEVRPLPRHASVVLMDCMSVGGVTVHSMNVCTPVTSSRAPALILQVHCGSRGALMRCSLEV